MTALALKQISLSVQPKTPTAPRQNQQPSTAVRLHFTCTLKLSVIFPQLLSVFLSHDKMAGEQSEFFKGVNEVKVVGT